MTVDVLDAVSALRAEAPVFVVPVLERQRNDGQGDADQDDDEDAADILDGDAVRFVFDSRTALAFRVLDPPLLFQRLQCALIQ